LRQEAHPLWMLNSFEAFIQCRLNIRENVTAL